MVPDANLGAYISLFANLFPATSQRNQFDEDPRISG